MVTGHKIWCPEFCAKGVENSRTTGSETPRVVVYETISDPSRVPPNTTSVKPTSDRKMDFIGLYPSY